MDFNIFKDNLFDLINESDVLDVYDIEADDRHNLLFITMRGGTKFRIHIEEITP